MTDYYDGAGNRKIPYKEDSTKGSSLLDPQNYKGDVLAQVWIDSRILATVSEWLDKGECKTRFMGDVVKFSLMILLNDLVESKEIEMIDDTMMARRILERKYRVNLNRCGRGGKNLLHNQILSDRRVELSEKVRSRAMVTDSGFRDVDRPAGKISRAGMPNWIPIEEYPDYWYPEGDEATKAKLIAGLKAAGVKSVREQVDEQTAAAIADARARKVSPEIERSATVKEGMSEEEFYDRAKKRDEEIIKRENAPIEEQIEFMKKSAVKI